MAREQARRAVPGAILHDDDLEPAEGVLLPEKALDRPLDGRFRIACGNDHADGGHPLQRVVPRCWCHVMSEARARPPSGERRVGLLRDKPTYGTCQVGNDVILLGFLSACHSSPAAIVNAVDTHEHDHAADASTLPATWERRGGWSEPLRCGRTARAGSGRRRLAEHSGELGALLRRELGLAALDRAHSANTEVGL